MIWALILSHGLAVCLGAGAMWAYSRHQVTHRELAAEFRGMRATVIAHSPEEAFRQAEGF